MAAARGVGPAVVVSIGLHLLIVVALWRSPAPVSAGPSQTVDILLAPALVIRPAPRSAGASAPSPGVAPKAATARRADPPASQGRAPSAALPSPEPPTARLPEAPPGSPPPPSVSPSVEDPYDAWSRQVWVEIDRRRPRAEAGASAARVAFSLDRNGRMTALRLASSSGAPDFDRAAMRAVRAAAPFPPPPAGIDAARLRFAIVIRSGGR